MSGDKRNRSIFFHKFYLISLRFPYFLMSLSSGWHELRANTIVCPTLARVADAASSRIFQKPSSLAALTAPQKVGIIISGCKLYRTISSIKSSRPETLELCYPTNRYDPIITRDLYGNVSRLTSSIATLLMISELLSNGLSIENAESYLLWLTLYLATLLSASFKHISTPKWQA